MFTFEGATDLHAKFAAFFEAGKQAGQAYYKNVLTQKKDLNEFFADIQRSMKELNIGIFRVESADLERGSFVVVVEEDLDPFRRGRHVGPFADRDAAVLHQGRGVLAVDLVLGRGGHRHLAGDLPDVAALLEDRVLVVLGVVLDAAALHFLELLDQVEVEPLLGRELPGLGVVQALRARELADDLLVARQVLVVLGRGDDGHVLVAAFLGFADADDDHAVMHFRDGGQVT